MAAKKKQPAPDDAQASSGDPFEGISGIIEGINKEAKRAVVVTGADVSANDLRGYISTGCFPLDAFLGEGKVRGGIPIGRFTELMGPESTGKTTFITRLMIACQRGEGTLLEWEQSKDETGRVKVVPVNKGALNPGLPILIDSEYKWPLDRAQNMGLDPTRFLRLRVKSLNEGIEELDKLLLKVKEKPYFQKLSTPVLVLWDSLGASETRKEMEAEQFSGGIAEKARTIRAMMRRMTPQLADLNVTVVFTNHTYSRIGAPGEESSGGRGLKYAASLRLSLKKGEKWLDGADEIGIKSTMRPVKSGICSPNFEVSMPIRFSTGIDDDYSMLDFIIENNKKFKTSIVEQAGAWYYLFPNDGKTPFKYSKFSELLDQADGLREVLQTSIMEVIQNTY